MASTLLYCKYKFDLFNLYIKVTMDYDPPVMTYLSNLHWIQLSPTSGDSLELTTFASTNTKQVINIMLFYTTRLTT